MKQNLNDGKIHSLEEIMNANPNIAAKQFSENNKYLEQTLLNLWSLGINTSACCKGTSEKDHKENTVFKIPYLLIEITPETQTKVLTFLDFLLNEKSSNKPIISFKSLNYNDKKRNVILLDKIFLSNKSCDNMFKNILNATIKMKSNEKINSNSGKKLGIAVIEELSKREISNHNIKEISIKIDSNGKSKFSIKNIKDKSLKLIINEKNYSKIQTIYENYTDETLNNQLI